MNKAIPSPYKVDYDLSSCSAEPVHLIRHYQSFASLLVVTSRDREVVAFSDDLPELLGIAKDNFFHRSIKDLLPIEAIEIIQRMVENDEYVVHNPINLINWGREKYPTGVNLVVHKNNDFLYLEFEPRNPKASTSTFLQRVDLSLQLIQAIGTNDSLYGTTTKEVKKLTGFDRVMLYRFDEEYNGQVVGEAKEDDLEPFLHLRYPSTDIPKQARDLMLKRSIRQLNSTAAEDVNGIVVSPEIEELDLTYSVAKGSSPIHLEYLRNMGVKSTLIIAIVLEGQLWGMISCHHYREKRQIDYRIRSMIGFMAKIVSSHLAFRRHAQFRSRILQTNIIRSRLFERMTEEFSVIDGLLKKESDLLLLTEADGAAILVDDKIKIIGQTPSEAEILLLANSLPSSGNIASYSHTAAQDFPIVQEFGFVPGGVLAIRLSSKPIEYIFWFRASVTQKINWAGNPGLRKEIVNNRVRLHPELSFKKWEQQMQDASLAWEEHQINAAITLRNDIKEVILLKFNEIRQLNSQLIDAYEELESFSYTVSHDLRAPLRNIKGYAEILQEDYIDNLDDYGKNALNIIISSVSKMNHFINDILAFSRLGRTGLIINKLDVNELVDEVWNELNGSQSPVAILKEIDTPFINGDYTQIKQLLFNLISNAIKYARPIPDAFVSIKVSLVNDQLQLVVSDNGIGFKMKYADRIFAVFSRLVSDESYPGTGVGLAITKRVAENHQGKIAVDSELGEGTTFTVTLPLHPKIKQDEEEEFKSSK